MANDSAPTLEIPWMFPLTPRQQPHNLRRELVGHLLHVRHWP